MTRDCLMEINRYFIVFDEQRVIGISVTKKGRADPVVRMIVQRSMLLSFVCCYESRHEGWCVLSMKK
jgi:hypothetical protein